MSMYRVSNLLSGSSTVIPTEYKTILEKVGAIFKKQNNTNSSDPALLKVIGQANIQYLIRKFREQEKYKTEAIGHSISKWKILEGKTVTDLDREADFSVDHKSVLQDFPAVDSDKMTLDNWYTQYGHTTFSKCGMCKHWGSQTSAGVSCGFLNRLDRAQAAPFDSPCLVRQMDAESFKKLVDALGAEVELAKKIREDVRAHIEFLQKLKKDALPSPAFPRFRPKGHFDFGDRVVVYSYSPAFKQKERYRWVPATVLRGSGDAIVCLDFPLLGRKSPRDQNYAHSGWKPYTLDVPAHSPYILSVSDFEHLRKLPSGDIFRQLWDDSCSGWQKEMYDNQSNSYIRINKKRFLASFNAQEEIIEEPAARLMSAPEAMRIMELSEFPKSAEVVVDAYRRLKTTKSCSPKLEQAKNTLLIRVLGSYCIAEE